MKVVYVLHSVDFFEGSSKAFRMMLTGLMPKGISPIVVLPAEGAMSEWCHEKGIPFLITTYRFATYPYWETPKDWLLFLPRLLARQWVNWRSVHFLVRELKTMNIDLIHTNVGVVDIGYRAACKLKVPHVFHIREFAEQIGMYYFPSPSRFRRFLKAKGSYSIAITRSVQQYYGLADSPSSEVIYDGVVSSSSIVPPLTTGRALFYVGRIEPIKGLLDLLQAYTLCRKRNIDVPQLLVAGDVLDESYMQEINQFLQDHHLQSLVQFLGQRSDIMHLMRSVRGVILPSLYEGFGWCMPEAMSCGCPVIVRDTTGLHEQLENGSRLTSQDIAFHFKTVNQLADCIQQLLTTKPDVLTGMIERAFTVVNQLYTIEAHIDGVFGFYQKISRSSHLNS